MTCAVFALAIRVAGAKSWRHRAQPARVSGERQSSRGLLLLTAEPAQQPHDGIEELVGHPLLERDDRVVRDVDVLGADLGTTLRDVAEADAGRVLDEGRAVDRVGRVHVDGGQLEDEARPRYRALAPLVAPDDVG